MYSHSHAFIPIYSTFLPPSLSLSLPPSLPSFPQLSGIWHISGLIQSLNTNRRRIGADLVNNTHKRLTAKGNTEDAAMISDSQRLFPQLIELAALQLKEKKLKWRMNVRLDLKRFLVPTQGALRARTRPPSPSTSRDRSHTSGAHTDKAVDTSYHGGDPNEVTCVCDTVCVVCVL